MDTERLRGLFNIHATVDATDDHDGMLDRHTVDAVLHTHSDHVQAGGREALLEALLHVLDDDGDGCISFTEFRIAYDEYPQVRPTSTLDCKSALCQRLGRLLAGHNGACMPIILAHHTPTPTLTPAPTMCPSSPFPRK